MIITIKEYAHRSFNSTINQYLSDGYEILNTSCGFEGNQDGMDAVFIAILQKQESDP